MSEKVLTCIFCGTKYFLDDAKEVDLKDPDGIIPFNTKESDVKESLIKWLKTSEFIPDNIETLNIESISGIYTPLYLLKIKYSTDWTATSIYDVKETYEAYETDDSGQRSSYPITKTKKVEKFSPANGRSNLNYEYLYAASQNLSGNSDIFEKLFRKYKNKIESLQEIQVKRYQFEPFIKIPEEQIHNLESFFSENIKKDIGKTIPGDRYKELNWSIAETDVGEKRYYIPLWVVNYEYNGNKYQAFLDGVSLELGEGKAPEDKEKIERVKQQEEQKKLFAEQEKNALFQEYKDMRKFVNLAYVIIVIYFLALIIFERLFYRNYYWNMIPLRSYLILHAVGLAGFILFYKITEAVRKKIFNDSDRFLKQNNIEIAPQKRSRIGSIIIKWIYILFLLYSIFLIYTVEHRKGFPQNVINKIKSSMQKIK
ncbi:MAG: hypothetical protein PHV06_01625 [bacterium]|nr:hypothetical protein [bacterium]